MSTIIFHLKKILLVLYFTHTSVAKSFAPCELSGELIQVYNFTYKESRNLACIAQKLSGLNTNVIGGDLYGIFQIHRNFCNEDGHKGQICDIECDDLLDENIHDDVRCVKNILSERGLSAWRFDKEQGCRKIFRNFDKRCMKNLLPKENRCEHAKKLSSLYNISSIDALVWACISEHDEGKPKTGNINEKSNQTCVINRDVECAIKNAEEIFYWPSYERCKNVNTEDAVKCFKHVEIIFPHGKKFTTSTEISIVFDEDLPPPLTSTSEKPELKSPLGLTDEGYSKIRVMKIEETTTKMIATTDEEGFDLNWDKEEIADQYEISHQYEQIDKCHLAESIKEYGNIPQNLISTFICIAEHESRLNVSLKTLLNGTTKYGLFQIDDQSYCNTNESIKECDVLCEHLNDDQLNNDLECVKKIFEKEGFQYWPSYNRHCLSINENSFEKCFNNATTTTHRPFTIVNNFHLATSTLTTQNPVFSTTESLDSDKNLCEFVNFLYKNKISLDDLGTFTCIAENSKMQENNKNNTFGPFGITREHCEKCMMNCSDLIEHHVVNHLKCAKKIFHENGLVDWNLKYDTCQSIYNSKILHCIDEGKFELNVEETDLKSRGNFETTTFTAELNDLSMFNSTSSDLKSNEDSTTKISTSGDYTTDAMTDKFKNSHIQDGDSSSYYTSVFEIFTTLSSTKEEN